MNRRGPTRRAPASTLPLVPLLLLALFIVLPLAELYVIIKVGEAIGILPTLAILIADSILGTVLLRSQG
ncbi:MAG: FxsA family protein, partial [Solirubrobacterales bacterium]